ncbi:MAG: radical SAM protein [Candidatus Omnitrophica bacterium]|nr:radical SAM protein [Candidatus Omnitrophota bacterium]
MDNRTEGYGLKFTRDSAPYRVFATWNIHYACNYKCAYCHAPKTEHKDARKALYLTNSEWLKIWEKNYQRYGTWEILISGGEPFTYPDFMQLFISLSRIHFVSVCTNLEWDVASFVKQVRPDRAKIETSFHPEFADLNKFTKKLRILKDSGFQPTVNFVPWPPILGIMQRVKEAVDAAGCQLTLQPFNGQFENRSYPGGYTEKEREYFKIFDDNCNLNTLDFKTTDKSVSTQGKLCRMGQNYAYIYPDGHAGRCCKDHTISLGNIIDGSFSLLEEPAVCNAKECNCWRCMLAGKEDFWQQHWGRPDISKIAMGQHKPDNDKAAFNIALIQAPVWGIYEAPVGLAQISSCLKKDSYRVSVFDLNIELYSRHKEEYKTAWAIEQSEFWTSEPNVKKFFGDHNGLVMEYLDKIAAANPALIGFSVNVCSLPASIELAKMLKKMIPDVKIAFGGPMFFVASDFSEVLKYDCIDIVVTGEAEETFLELAAFLRERKDLISCKGIYFKKDAKVIKTEARPPIKDLDELPFLDLESFPLEKYNPPGHLGKHISLMTSRGCVLNCAYCGPRAYWKGFRFTSGARIYDEIKYHLQNNPDIEHVEFLDLELNGNIKALNDFCDLMIADPPKAGLKWHANIVIRPEMDCQLLSKMRRAGCHHISIGIETGSQKILDLMKKRYRIEDAQAVLKYAHEAGIHVTTNFMFGFPQETEDDFKLTLEFLRRNSNVIGTVYPSRSFFTIEPFSYVAEHMEEFGIIGNQHNNLYWESKDGQNNYLERLRRCEEFSRLALELKVPIGLGLQTSIELDRYYNLGSYYESKKDLQKAGSFFKEYLKLDPKNTVINKKLSELELVDDDGQNYTGVHHGNGQVSFNWDITSICNYRCPYCWFYGKWVEMKKDNINIPIPKLQDFWGRIYDSYGPVKISITGGEPFLYPDFVELINSISKWHKIDVVTNLSWPVASVIDEIRPENIRIHPSFHLFFSEFGDFVEKVICLRKKGIADNPSFVAWPAQVASVKHYAKKFKEYGITMFAQPFFGEYKGAYYPDGYSDSQRKAIAPYLGERGGEVFHTTVRNTKGKLCHAGCLYGVIHPDGTVLRCGGIKSRDAQVGNILDKDFKLFNQAYPCTSEVCPCNEWVFLLKDK